MKLVDETHAREEEAFPPPARLGAVALRDALDERADGSSFFSATKSAFSSRFAAFSFAFSASFANATCAFRRRVG